MAEKSLRARPNAMAERALKCWLDARLGRHFEARLRLERLAADDFAELRHDSEMLASAAALGQACIFLKDEVRHHAARIYELLLPYANRQIAVGQIVGLGPVSFYLGRLANHLSNTDAAIEHLGNAVNLNLRLEAKSLAILAQLEQSSVLLKDGDPHRYHTGSELLAQVEAQISTGDMGGLAHRAAEIRLAEINNPARDPLEALRGSVTGRKVFRREGDFWNLAYGGHLARVRHLKGLALISYLLAQPNEPIHCIELAKADDARRACPDDAAQSGQMVEFGPMLDREAKEAYRSRARGLREELVEAQRFNDIGRAEKIEQELRFLTRELASAVGLFGRDRANGSSGERARLRVTFAIKSSIRRISVHHESLARHMDSSIKTGRFCVYRPENNGAGWEL
jgi:hypothetical protein